MYFIAYNIDFLFYFLVSILLGLDSSLERFSQHSCAEKMGFSLFFLLPVFHLRCIQNTRVIGTVYLAMRLTLVNGAKQDKQQVLYQSTRLDQYPLPSCIMNKLASEVEERICSLFCLQ